MRLRIVFVGCVHFSRSALEKLLKIPEAEIVGVVTQRASGFNADFCSLDDLAKGIPIFYQRESEDLLGFVLGLRADVLYCFGWSHLLPKEVLEATRLGGIGSHPAELPKNRGRHPIVWALALGLERTASSFFFMDEGADSGDLISQEAVPIAFTDTAATLYQKITDVALRQIESFTKDLAKGSYRRIPQSHVLATNWRKRGKADGRIDWRMSSTAIYNLVRALTKPYVGAHVELKGCDVKIWEAAIADSEARGLENLEPGLVLAVGPPGIVVKCYAGAVRLLRHEFSPLPNKGDYL